MLTGGDHILEAAVGRVQGHRLLEEHPEADPCVLLGDRMLGRDDELPERVLEHRIDELLLGREVPVQRSHTDARVPGDLLHRRLDPVAGKENARARDDPVAVALSITAQRLLTRRRSGHPTQYARKRSVRSGFLYHRRRWPRARLEWSRVMASTPETQYALSGGNHIAYQVADGAERDILYVPRTTTPIDLLWDDPIVARGLRRLTACGRLIMCDLRGWGASDSIDTTRLPAMQAWMDDIGAVLDAAESDQATLVAGSESALPLMLFAATNPDRTTGLVLINAFARFLRTPETPFGIPPESAERYVELYRSISGRGALVDYLAPTRSSEPAFRRWSTRSQRLGAGPGTAAAIYDVFMHTDLSGVLPSIRVPTLVLHREGDQHVRRGHAQFLADRIPGAQLVTLPGEDNEWFSGDIEPLFDEIEQFVTGIRRARRTCRRFGSLFI